MKDNQGRDRCGKKKEKTSKQFVLFIQFSFSYWHTMNYLDYLHFLLRLDNGTMKVVRIASID